MFEILERDAAVQAAVDRRRDELTDAFVTDYDYVDSETGHKIKEEKVAGPQGTSHTFEADQTKLFTAGPSTTSDVEILVIEAELVDEGKDLDNPHIPLTEEKWSTAVDRLDSEGLEPAWTTGGESA